MSMTSARKSVWALFAGVAVFCLAFPPVSGLATVPPIIGVVRCDTVGTLFGYRIVPLGDQNGDGHADFLVWDFRNMGFVCYGGNPLPTTPGRRIHGIHTLISNIGDINGDRFDDIAACQSKLGLYLGGGGLDTVPSLAFGADTVIPIGYAVSTADAGCAGRVRILSGTLNQNCVGEYDIGTPSDSVPICIFRPWWFHHPGYIFGEALAAGDFNGDGKRDIAVNLRPYEQYSLKSQVCIYYGGCGFDTIPDLLFSQPGAYDRMKVEFGMVMQNIGDFNGDGYDDLFVGHWESEDSTGLIYYGGPSFDSIPDLTLVNDPTRVSRGKDLNGDGYEDLITSYPLESSSFSYVDVFYGGPHVDSIPDIRINVWEMPEYLLSFGMAVAGVGDVNGDGINDFAVSAVDGGNHGVVFVFSGNRSGTAVDPEGPTALPSGFTLYPAYPNPFNGSTAISFDLPRRGHVRVDLFDIVGRHVSTLVDGECSARSHRAEWDPGRGVASGVYLCRVQFEGEQKVLKILLLK